MTSMRLIPRYPEDDIEQEAREDPAERAIHDVYEAVERLWELVAPQEADWIVLTANIQADRKFRRRQAQ